MILGAQCINPDQRKSTTDKDFQPFIMSPNNEIFYISKYGEEAVLPIRRMAWEEKQTREATSLHFLKFYPFHGIS